MTTTTWTSAPAGVLGQGIADVRPYSGVVVCPTPDAAHSTGLSAARRAAEVRGMAGDALVRLRPLTGAVAVLARTDRPIARNAVAQQFTDNDVPTLGIRSPGRPQS